MNEKFEKILAGKCSRENLDKLKAVPNEALHSLVSSYVEHCSPDSVFVRSSSPEDTEYIRKKSVERGEEQKLATEGHTAHFDGYRDQARDKEHTCILLPPDVELGAGIKTADLQEGLKEVKGFLKDSMKGKEMLVGFFCLGPENSEFSILAVQITDSCYVMHSEDMLVRNGYEEFKKRENTDFLKFIHSAGKLDGSVSAEVDKRRVYIDINGNTVYSANTQYAGNTVGLKKLAMRLTIKKASQEGWLTEHMFVMGVKGPQGRTSYFTGAYPSACGKTATAMIEGESIVGDDIAYLRKINGRIMAVNVERGLFGIIADVNEKDVPVIWKALTTPGEVIFSNVLVADGKPYWLGDGREIPEKGVNYSGQWHKGKTDENGKELTHSHKNARFTVRIKNLDNSDELADAPSGVPVKGIIYGGRDSDTCVPVEEAFDWNHGILTKGATLESETTAATLGKEGVRTFNLMANLDFISIPVGKYITNNCKFADGVESPPGIFSVNYFLKDKNGEYLNGMHDKKIWLKWMELRVNGEAGARRTPTGFIPLYEDLKELFSRYLGKDYSPEDYNIQFTVRVPENLTKLDRIEKIYRERIPDTPEKLFNSLNSQRERLEAAAEKYGDYITPEKFEKI